jgi:lipopolysaccharide export system protein LptA
MTFTKPSARLWISFVLTLLLQPVWGQKKVTIKHADEGRYVSGKTGGEEKNTLLGNVVFFHEGALMYCDSAWFYSATNSLKAFGNVRINQGDTLFLYSDFLDYDGNTKQAVMRKNVRMVDDSTRLYTEKLYYDRVKERGYYNTGGRIEDGATTLISKEGIYHSQTKWYHFRKDVVVTNPEYVIESDTMHYHTERKVTLFKGPSTITGDSSFIYCENGIYNTVTDIAQFEKNALIRDKNTFLTGDSIYYEQQRGFGQAFENVVIYDTTEHYTIRGQYGEYLREPEYAYVTGSPTYSMKTDEDSLHIYGDTLYSRAVDTLGQKVVTIWPRVKFFKEDLQGKCDSLVYQDSDSSFYLFRDPVIWNDSTQMTGKNIIVTMANGSTDSLKIYTDAFVLSKEDYEFHHQVKGRDMFGKFVDDKIKTILVKGNGQSLYVIREDNDEENPPYIGINRADCSEILIRFEDGEIDQIVYIKQAEAKTYPMKDVNEALLKLDGFYPRFKERPKSKEEIYPTIKQNP